MAVLIWSSHEVSKAIAMNTPMSVLVGQRHSAPRATLLSAVMVTLGVIYVPKSLSAMVIFARHAKLKDASRQLPTLTTSSTRQAAVPMTSTTFRHFAEPVTRPRRKRRAAMPKVNIVCQHCGKVVTRKLKPSRKDAGKYCSRECAFQVAGVLKVERKALRDIARNIRKLNKINATKLRNNLKRQAYIDSAKQCICKSCGISFEKFSHLGGPKKYCEVCKEKISVEKERKYRRVFKSKRRAKIRNTKTENIDPFDIFDSFGWKCYLCGTSTPKARRGTYKENAPELDHIIPLSKGGTHTKDNLACCCRACNHKKSDSMPRVVEKLRG